MSLEIYTIAPLAFAMIDDERAGRNTYMFPHAHRDWGLVTLAATIIGLATWVSSCALEKSRVDAAAAVRANSNTNSQ
jgi:hypothetical protein